MKHPTGGHPGSFSQARPPDGKYKGAPRQKKSPDKAGKKPRYIPGKSFASNIGFRPLTVRRLLTALLLAIIGANIAMIPVAAYLISDLKPGDFAGLMARLLSPQMILLQVAVLDGFLVLLMFIAVVAPGHLGREDLGLGKDKLTGKNALVGLLLGLVIAGICSAFISVQQAAGWGTGQWDITIKGDDSAFILMFLAAVVIAPVCEEIFFRGYALAIFENKWGTFPAIILSGGLFGVVHLNKLQLVPLSLAGVVLGYVRVKYGLGASIIAHALNNLLAIVLLYYGI